MNCSDFVRARKGGHHPEQSLTTYDKTGLFPFLCLTDNILSLVRFFKHRMTELGGSFVATGWGVLLVDFGVFWRRFFGFAQGDREITASF